MSVEHIVPQTLGGSDELENLALACQTYNNFKFVFVESLDSVSDQVVPLYHPRLHLWDEHFTWNEEFTVLFGTSPTGRATVQRLRLNRVNVVNLRRLLLANGLRPPHWEKSG